MGLTAQPQVYDAACDYCSATWSGTDLSVADTAGWVFKCAPWPLTGSQPTTTVACPNHAV